MGISARAVFESHIFVLLQTQTKNTGLVWLFSRASLCVSRDFHIVLPDVRAMNVLVLIGTAANSSDVNYHQHHREVCKTPKLHSFSRHSDRHGWGGKRRAHMQRDPTAHGPLGSWTST